MLLVLRFGLEPFQISSGAKFRSTQSEAPSRQSPRQCRTLAHRQTERKHTSARHVDRPVSSDLDQIGTDSKNTCRSDVAPTGKPERLRPSVPRFLRFADLGWLADRLPKPVDKAATIRGRPETANHRL